jgi:hypothetical protein
VKYPKIHKNPSKYPKNGSQGTWLMNLLQKQVSLGYFFEIPQNTPCLLQVTEDKAE